MVDYVEIEFMDFINKIFDDEPKTPHYYKHIIDSNNSGMDTEDIFTFYMEIFRLGCVKLIGDENNRVNFSNCTNNHIRIMEEYFASISVKIKINIIENIRPNDVYKYDNTDNNINLSNLRDYKYNIIQNNNVYQISFDYL